MENEDKITLWKKKKLLNNLANARGNGTSMISLIIPPKEQVPKVMQMLLDEYGTASNIKSKVNRLSVLSAITSTKERLKLYNNRKLENGLAIFCGTIIREDGKEKKINIDIEPHKPINNSLYMCDNKFHVEPLIELYNDEEKFGFLIMDGSGSLYGTVQGNQKNILHKFSVELPKKHRKGGQSSMRFARLRLEKRHAYITKVAEGCVHHFIKDDKVCVKGIIFGGSAEFKDLLKSSDSLDFRIKEKIISVVDIAYGGEQGFNQAIELASESIGNVKLLDEKKLLTKYFDEIAQDTGNYCFGIKDTMFALESGAVDTFIIWEECDLIKHNLINTITKIKETVFLKKGENITNEHLINKQTSETLEKIDEHEFLEWIIENYQDYGINLEIIGDRTPEGSQFCKGFGGIGAILRYKIDLNQDFDEELDFDSDIDFDDIF